LISSFVFSQECVILDACCIINLYASGQMGNILKSIPKSVTVAAYVHAKEVMRIHGGPNGDITQKYERIDLQPFINSGLLTIVSPETEAENLAFVNFATALDDGEAITGAIALHRNWSIATDDRKATSFFTQNMPHIQTISTPELIKYWVDTTHPPVEVLCTALQQVRTRARYEPDKRHKLYSWWQKYKEY
jgi:predicted nucleic acid-binding protein